MSRRKKTRTTKFMLKAIREPSLICFICGMSSALFAQSASAFEFDTNDPDLKIRWDNTLRYTLAGRVKEQSPALINSLPITINQDDGDRAFNRGLIENRVDLFSEFDLTYKNFGGRVSAAAWYDAVYNRSNDGNSPATFNPFSVPFNEFTKTARNLDGRYAEILDAFVFGKGELGDKPVTFRVGQHALLWGESLFFGNNGIAGTMSSIDIIKLLSVPNALFREVVRPDAQASAQVQLTSDLSLAAYYKFTWQSNRLPPGGSYFASTDILIGGERLFTAGAPFPSGARRALFRDRDEFAGYDKQGGLAVKWRPDETDLDLGFFAIHFNDRNPQIYQYPGVGLNPTTGQIGVYHLVYPENITAYGVSASSTFGAVNLAGEISFRRNATLLSEAQVVPANFPADNNKNPLYAVGNTAHAQVSALWSIEPNVISREASLAAEIAWNRRLSITKNPAALASFSERDAWGMRLVYTPTYRQVAAGLDISVPVGFSYFPEGKSSAVAGFGVDRGGDFTIGVTGAYLDTWRASLSYTGYYGPEGTFLVFSPAGRPTFSFAQSLKDRNFVALSLSVTF